MTARRMISGEVLKYRNEFLIHRRYGTCFAGSSQFALTRPFNSLDAQREACEAYIQSQKHEGWRPIKTRYDDGGFSGGSMDRPGLQQLLDDFASGQVQVVVVYKVGAPSRHPIRPSSKPSRRRIPGTKSCSPAKHDLSAPSPETPA